MAYNPVTLTGQIKDSTGSPSTASGTLWFELSQNGNCISGGFGVTTNAITFVMTNGVIAALSKITANDDISPAGTFYRMTFVDSNGTVVVRRDVQLNGPGTSIDIGTLSTVALPSGTGAQVSIPVTIVQGGTGATSAAAARTALGVPGVSPGSDANAVGTSRTLTATAPVRIDGGASADLSADRTLSVSQFTDAAAGTVPPSGGGTTNFMRADGTWAPPPGGAGGYATIQDEGTPLTVRTALNVIGGALTAADDGANSRTNITLSMSPSSASAVGTGRQVATGSGLTGGGDLSADRTLSIPAAGVTDSMLGTSYVKADGSRALTADWNAGTKSIYFYNGLRVYNVKDGFSAKCDGKELYDGATTSGSPTFTSATANFTVADQTKRICIAQALPITGATNASPIEITTAGSHGMTNGDVVYITGVGGNKAANGYRTITVTAANKFTIGVAGTGAYTSGGTVSLGFTTTIQTYVNATTVTLAATATANGIASKFVFGTDDTAAVQAACTAAGAAGGGTVYVPPGITMWKHTAAAGTVPSPGIRVSPNTRIIGAGRKATQIQGIGCASGEQVYDLFTNLNSLYNSTNPAPQAVDTGITIAGMTLDGGSLYHIKPHGNSDGTAHGVFLSRVADCLVTDVRSQYHQADGVAYEYSFDSRAENCSTFSNRKAGLYASGCENIAFVGNVSSGDGQGGVTFAVSWHCSYTANVIRDWGYYGAAGAIDVTGDARYISISSNIISGGIASALAAINVNQRTIGTNCTIHGLTYGAIADPSGAFPYGARYNSIVGNTIKGNAGIGIWLGDWSDSNNVLGNVITDNGNYGVLLQGAQRNQVIGNRILNNSAGVTLQATSQNRPTIWNTVRNNHIADEYVYEFQGLTGTVTTNLTTTLNGVGTLFTTEIHAAGAVSPAIPVLIAGESVPHYVTNVTSDTVLTLQTAASTNSAGHAISGPKLVNQLTHPAVTQSIAVQEITPGIGGGTIDFNEITDNTGNGTYTYLGATSKIYGHQGGTSGRISATADLVGLTSTVATDITGATTGTFTALRTGSMLINASVFGSITAGAGAGNFLVIECQVSTNGGAYVAQTPNSTTNYEASRTATGDTWCVQLTAGNTYAIKLTARMTPANTTTYSVYGGNKQTGFTYRFV